MRNVTLMVVGGVGAMVLGLPYIYRAFGPTEAEVVLWGKVSLYAGIVLILFSLTAGHKRARMIIKLILGLGYLILSLLQVPPILLWFLFHGSGISDGTPPSSFVAHWGYAIPHIILLTICVFILSGLLRRTPPPS